MTTKPTNSETHISNDSRYPMQCGILPARLTLTPHLRKGKVRNDDNTFIVYQTWQFVRRFYLKMVYLARQSSAVVKDSVETRSGNAPKKEKMDLNPPKVERASLDTTKRWRIQYLMKLHCCILGYPGLLPRRSAPTQLVVWKVEKYCDSIWIWRIRCSCIRERGFVHSQSRGRSHPAAVQLWG